MLRTTHTSSVTEDQIDHLGHMNVRFYAVNAQAATRRFLGDLGWGEVPYEVHDVYTRHHREQLLGTPLEVRSAVLEARPDALRLHHELAAADSDVLAATFVHVISPVGRGGARTSVAPAVQAAAAAIAIEAPEHAAARTIALDADPLAGAPSLDLVRARGLAMRKPREVGADECDTSGRYRIEMAPMLTWGGEPMTGEPSDMLYVDDEGRHMGWASMETRMQVARLPRAGDGIQSFGAAIAVHDKVTHRIHWTYDLASGELLTAFEVVSLAFDIGARRPMSLPEPIRRHELDRLQPDLAPRPASD